VDLILWQQQRDVGGKFLNLAAAIQEPNHRLQ